MLIRPAWDVEKQASKRRRHSSQKDMEEKILFTVSVDFANLYVRKHN